jgi:hypothetical protein
MATYDGLSQKVGAGKINFNYKNGFNHFIIFLYFLLKIAGNGWEY